MVYNSLFPAFDPQKTAKLFIQNIFTKKEYFAPSKRKKLSPVFTLLRVFIIFLRVYAFFSASFPFIPPCKSLL
jgi:hypothetical protein